MLECLILTRECTDRYVMRLSMERPRSSLVCGAYRPPCSSTNRGERPTGSSASRGERPYHHFDYRGERPVDASLPRRTSRHAPPPQGANRPGSSPFCRASRLTCLIISSVQISKTLDCQCFFDERLCILCVFSRGSRVFSLKPISFFKRKSGKNRCFFDEKL